MMGEDLGAPSGGARGPRQGRRAASNAFRPGVGSSRPTMISDMALYNVGFRLQQERSVRGVM